MNSLLGAVCAFAMLLVTGSFIRGTLAFLVCVITLVVFLQINGGLRDKDSGDS